MTETETVEVYFSVQTRGGGGGAGREVDGEDVQLLVCTRYVALWDLLKQWWVVIFRTSGISGLREEKLCMRRRHLISGLIVS